MIFSNWIARYCSWIFRSSFSPKVSSFPPSKILFLMSCWVRVLPPPALESPVMIPTAARTIERTSTPLWDQNLESSIATKASIRHWGSSS